MRLIDADALVAQMKADAEQIEEPIAAMFAYAAISDVEHAPTIEPEQKKGTWLVHLYKLGRDRYECDQCQGRCDMGYKYCPNCGADMRGDQNELN